ncbi:uncharacterized protein LOC129571836 [Sitodiplosis mosellana]|uniref:uncharacterized protein LOC129571836 n=1 Tax=Sitodiplosis mosellana TaxID=263140 RepID=UPI0024441938|nr:uncharacterized protein LOC129571836 [Sitodiplosis mosellana]
MSNHSDLSLLTVSSGLVDPNFLNIGHRLNSSKQRLNKLSRETSPIPNALDVQRPAFLSERNDLFRSCGKLSTLLGIQRSFSTNDITNKTLETVNSRTGHRIVSLRHTVSELALNSFLRYGYMKDSARLSRSCSTWVAVGELDTSTSQLPSPHGHCTSSLSMNSSQQQLSPSNLFGHSQIASISQPSSVNKNIRESYIRNRLLTTHRAIERLSQSEFNLDQLATMATTTITVSEGLGPVETVQLIIPEQYLDKPTQAQPDDTLIKLSTTTQKSKYKLIGATSMGRNLTIQDIEKERGRPLSKYDRNYMIFNWLHSIDQTSTAEDKSEL